MTSSLSLRPPTGSPLECGLHHILPFRRQAGLRHDKALCGATRICSTQTIIRSVASNFAKLTNHTKVNNVESSTNGLLTSTTSHLDAPLSPVDLSLLHSHVHTHETRKEIPVDGLGKGSRLINNKRVYRQIFVIRSYEVGFNKTAPIETITNLFQETSLNHAGQMNFVGDGMGTTHAMIRNRLIWIVTRMHIEMARYPVWGDVVQIDSWVSRSGKNGMRRDFLVRDYGTGLTLGRATSNWAMMNQDTRKLSKMPEEVRDEISTEFLDRSVMNEEDYAFTRIPLLDDSAPFRNTFNTRIPLLDDSAPFRSTGLAPRILDLDMNQHVNHVKYIGWLLESVPQSLMMSCELSRVTLEYRRECGSSDMLESLAQSDMTSNLDNSEPKSNDDGPIGFMHLLRLCGSGTEVLRGRTQWKSKRQHHNH